MRLALGVAIALSIAACKRKQHEEAPAGHAPAEPAVPAPRTTADALIAEALARENDGMQVAGIEARYVRADGTFDPTHGGLTVTLLGPEPPDLAVDPSRPIGAPVEAIRADRPCRQEEWSAKRGWLDHRYGRYGTANALCMLAASGDAGKVGCSVPSIWQRAIADGAPKTALAKLSLWGYGRSSRWWELSIEDEPREIRFRHRFRQTYRDDAADCPPVVEAAP